jgi:hypothetical protein
MVKVWFKSKDFYLFFLKNWCKARLSRIYTTTSTWVSCVMLIVGNRCIILASYYYQLLIKSGLMLTEQIGVPVETSRVHRICKSG